jgi:hypothetical protein
VVRVDDDARRGMERVGSELADLIHRSLIDLAGVFE